MSLALTPHVRWYGLTNSGICTPFSFSVRTIGRSTTADRFMMSSGGTASSNSNARTSVYTSAFILRGAHQLTRTSRLGATHSTMEKRYPMHARGPPRKLSRCAHTPGIPTTASGIFSQRSGLGGARSDRDTRMEMGTYLNSNASSPQSALERLTARMGINMSVPLSTLHQASAPRYSRQAHKNRR